MPGSNTSINFENDRVWLVPQVSTAHKDHTKLLRSKSEHDLANVNFRFSGRLEYMTRVSPWFSALGAVVLCPLFVFGHNAMEKSSLDSPWIHCLQVGKCCLLSLHSTRTGPNTLLSGSHHHFESFEIGCCVTSSDLVKSFWHWQKFSLSNALKPIYLKPLSCLPLWRSSKSESPL